MVSRLDRIIGERTAHRHAMAVDRVEPLLRELRADDIDIVVIGSLARDAFKSHSDVDLLVRGELTTSRRQPWSAPSQPRCAGPASPTT
ncbi:tRNA nucleotidyltransferase (CCA-adding enzyme) [Bradyrhizobium sp. USDA 4369]